MNMMKTVFLMALMTVLLIFIGGILGGRGGMMMAFVMAALMNFGTYWFSSKIVLSMYKAQEIQREDNQQLFRTVEELSQRAGIPMPKIYIIPDDQPNAFATGRNPEHAVVAVTEGILKLMPADELKGVLAHELAHIKHRDILIGSIAATMAGAISMLANMAHWAMLFGGGRHSDDDDGQNPVVMIVTMLVAPIAAMLVQMAISRSREFEADAGGAEYCGNPLNLANALKRLDANVREIPMDASPSTAHMFIVNPLSAGSITKLFSTHPPIEERVARLEAMVYGSSLRS